jgi:bifunctional DNA-binding transcriptional regulator/antitoxin component of YhaV-PrlF toxin-antitoxin module
LTKTLLYGIKKAVKKLKLTKLSSQGQLTLTKEMMNILQIVPNKLLEVCVDAKSNEIIIRKPKSKTKKYLGILKDKVCLTTDEYLTERNREAGLTKNKK